jgi:hypothetical protein
MKIPRKRGCEVVHSVAVSCVGGCLRKEGGISWLFKKLVRTASGRWLTTVFVFAID